MESRVKLLGHPIHQMLVPIPAGLFIVAAILDVVGLFVETSWIPTVTFWNIALGICAGLVAAVFGVLDFRHIPKTTRARRIGTLHGLGNVIAVVFFAAALVSRIGAPRYEPGVPALMLEISALLLLGATAWLGGELVDRLGVGVDDGANVNAPSSLRVKHVKPRS